ncbi:MAG: murein biosynthesis integral membrane protein MurJ [Candidatus Limnocylindria bacterium]
MSLARSLLARLLPRGAVLLSALLFGSYVMGLLRDRIFARTFGAGAELDAYNAAFVLPELTLDVLVASGLAAPFIPIFLQLRGETTNGGSAKDDQEANEFGQTILTGAVLVMGAAAAIMFVFAAQTTAVIAPGFDAEQREMYVALFRVMLITPIIFAASLTLGDVLLAERRFLAYGAAPLLYNAGIIAGTVALSGAIGIFGAAVGAVVGALLHLGVRLWGLRHSSFRIRARLAVRTRAVGEFVRLMLPKMASHPIEPLTFLYFTAVATTLGAGSVTAVSFARNFQSVPVSLIGVSFSLAAFPTLASAFAARDRRRFGAGLATNLVAISVLTGASAVALYLLSGVAIGVLLGGGAFDAADIALTSTVLAAFAISVPFESLTHLLSRAIYATHNTLLQVLASLGGFGLTVAVTGLLAPRIGITAIPLGFAAGQVARVALLSLALAWRLRAFGGEPLELAAAADR